MELFHRTGRTPVNKASGNGHAPYRGNGYGNGYGYGYCGSGKGFGKGFGSSAGHGYGYGGSRTPTLTQKLFLTAVQHAVII